jgi:hypothetical protein
VQSTYNSGGCYNLTSIAMTVTCGNGSNAIGIPEDQAGYSGNPTGTIFQQTVPATSCIFRQDEGWTGFNSPICKRNLYLYTVFQAPPVGCN